MYPEDKLDHWFKGQGLWKSVPEEEWKSWAWQLRHRITTLSQLEEKMKLTSSEREGCLFANKKLSLAITPYFFNLIDRENANCPIRKQVIPRSDEMYVGPEEMLDPVGEEDHMPVPGLVHRYPDRVLFLVTDRCAAYCRFCTRSRLVSNAQGYDFHPQLELGLQYLREHQEIRDVLLSGGDPLVLSDQKLDYILGELRKIEHVEFIRIGSRVPTFLPQRVTSELCDVLKKNGPVWLSLHIAHPRECTLELKEACDRLAFAGVPLGNQCVLLKDINDDLETMKSLMHRLLMMRVKPYYLYQCDLITGSAHLRADIQKGIDIIRGLRGHTSGYGVPQFVIDAPEGGGKIPINPEYVQDITEEAIVMKNFAGDIYHYPLGGKRIEKEVVHSKSKERDSLLTKKDLLNEHAILKKSKISRESNVDSKGASKHSQ